MTNRIGIDFPFRMIGEYSVEEVVGKLSKVVSNIDIYQDDFRTDKRKDITAEVVKMCGKFGLTVSIHATGIDGLYTQFHSEEDVDRAVANNIRTLKPVRELLDKYTKTDVCTLVFHLGEPNDKVSKEKLVELTGLFLTKLGDSLKSLKIKPCIELLSINHPKCNSIGIAYSDVKGVLSATSSSNVGICWDTGHTRLNTFECNTDIVPPDCVVSRTAFTHIHGWTSEGIDHADYKQGIKQSDELRKLKQIGYAGVYSLEYDFNNVKFNLPQLIENISDFKQFLNSI